MVLLLIQMLIFTCLLYPSFAALSPFILNSRLKGLMLKGSMHPQLGVQTTDKYIINVSAMEGKFYRHKSPCVAFGTMVFVFENGQVITRPIDEVVQAFAAGRPVQLLGQDQLPVNVVSAHAESREDMVSLKYSVGHHLATPNHLVTLRFSGNPRVTVRYSESNIGTVQVNWWCAKTLRFLHRRWDFLPTDASGSRKKARAALELSTRVTTHLLPANFTEVIAREYAWQWLVTAEKLGSASPLRVGDLIDVRASTLRDWWLAGTHAHFFKIVAIPLVDPGMAESTQEPAPATTLDIEANMALSDVEMHTIDLPGGKFKDHEASCDLAEGGPTDEDAFHRGFLHNRGLGVPERAMEMLDIVPPVSEDVAVVRDEKAWIRKDSALLPSPGLMVRSRDMLDSASLSAAAPNACVLGTFAFRSAKVDDSVDVVYMVSSEQFDASETLSNTCAHRSLRLWLAVVGPSAHSGAVAKCDRQGCISNLSTRSRLEDLECRCRRSEHFDPEAPPVHR